MTLLLGSAAQGGGHVTLLTTGLVDCWWGACQDLIGGVEGGGGLTQGRGGVVRFVVVDFEKNGFGAVGGHVLESSGACDGGGLAEGWAGNKDTAHG